MNGQGRFSAHLERLSTVPGLRRDVSALVVLVVVGVVAAAIIKSYLGGSTPWADNTIVKAEFAQVPGLNPKSQNSVTIAGVKVGTVTGAKATSHGTAVITMEITGSHKVFRDARAVLRPKNPLNEMQVELSPGTPAGEAMPRGGTIPLAHTERPVQADEILSHLDERSQVALTDMLLESDVALARAPQNLGKAISSTTDTLKVAQPVVEALQTRRAKIATLVTALSDISSAVGKDDKRITRLASSTQKTLAVLAGGDDALRASLAQLPGLTDQVRAALTSTQKLTTQLDPTLDNLHQASGALPPALKGLKSTVGHLDDTVTAAKPVLERARPVIADLRPTVANLDTSLGALNDVTSRLAGDTRTIMTYLTDVKAFVYNTSSVFGAGDTNGGIIRGHLMVPLPGAGVLPNSLTQGGGDR
ncbi:MAG: Mammalian cell entry related domain protein [Aeromicrobium sp.]|jgi:phospholipid/cholesterol/gamma-HCH transport system substrate-binding protein|uniref:MlaD family protein n=1 Tax=Aeromicrobium sp. TaxID=1871063 RepID=UPI00262ECB04|nr:MlaD family protein [Aeromicrobium sp.]MCW2789621.1 Mammalian cell entry related domain protein [Aeromicrobium sp.]MCW2824988.1 Mammalian cell entry related domain protein [Aeromicrobium sp.]